MNLSQQFGTLAPDFAVSCELGSQSKPSPSPRLRIQLETSVKPGKHTQTQADTEALYLTGNWFRKKVNYCFMVLK